MNTKRIQKQDSNLHFQTSESDLYYRTNYQVKQIVSYISFILYQSLPFDLSSSSAYSTKIGQLPPGSPVECHIRYLLSVNPSSFDVNFDCLLPICTTSSAIYRFQLVACLAILRVSILMTFFAHLSLL